MTYNFCTFFDRNYLYKGLALYYSLAEHCDDFNLWIVCFDDISYSILKKIDLINVHLISMEEFEDEGLFRIKNTRSVAEYCWTCTPSVPLFILQKERSLDHIAYLDADLFFYSDPAPIFKEFEVGSILITEHRYSNNVKHYEKKYGKYNVQFMIFKNNAIGLECLKWWRDRCIEWCYARPENGKFGDQKYLDDWTGRFKDVVVLKNKGGGISPWNLSNYQLSNIDDKLYVDDNLLIFFHFHTFNILTKNKFDLVDGYKLTKNQINLVYMPYIKSIKHIIDIVNNIDPAFNYGFQKSIENIIDIAILIKRLIKRNYYIIEYEFLSEERKWNI
jgi:hypothetical protein